MVGARTGSLQIVERNQERITKFTSEKDNGQYDAIAKGFSMATGDIYCWLNSDDTYFPWTMRIVARIFCDFAEIQWLMGVRCKLVKVRCRGSQRNPISARRNWLGSLFCKGFGGWFSGASSGNEVSARRWGEFRGMAACRITVSGSDLPSIRTSL